MDKDIIIKVGISDINILKIEETFLNSLPDDKYIIAKGLIDKIRDQADHLNNHFKAITTLKESNDKYIATVNQQAGEIKKLKANQKLSEAQQILLKTD